MERPQWKEKASTQAKEKTSTESKEGGVQQRREKVSVESEEHHQRTSPTASAKELHQRNLPTTPAKKTPLKPVYQRKVPPARPDQPSSSTAQSQGSPLRNQEEQVPPEMDSGSPTNESLPEIIKETPESFLQDAHLTDAQPPLGDSEMLQIGTAMIPMGGFAPTLAIPSTFPEPSENTQSSGDSESKHGPKASGRTKKHTFLKERPSVTVTSPDTVENLLKHDTCSQSQKETEEKFEFIWRTEFEFI